MSSSGRDEVIFGFTDKEVKFLIMSLKCIETHGNHRFLNCERLAELTGYSSADVYELYMGHLLQKITALSPVDLTGGSHDQTDADTATTPVAASQARTPAVEEDGKVGSAAGKDDETEKEEAEKDVYNVYKGIGDGVDGAGGNAEDEKELEALGSAYAWDR